MENPFKKLSELLIDNQNSLDGQSQHLRTQIRIFSQKINKVIEQLEEDVFSTDLNILSGIDIEASKILENAKDIEVSRTKIINSIELLQKANTKTLNK